MKTKTFILFITMFSIMPVMAQTLEELEVNILEEEKNIEREKEKMIRLENAAYEKAKRVITPKLKKGMPDYNVSLCSKEAEELTKLGFEWAPRALMKWCNDSLLSKPVTDDRIKGSAKNQNDSQMQIIQQEVERKALQAQKSAHRDKKTKEANQAIKDIDEILENKNYSNHLTEAEKNTLENGRDILRNQNLRRRRILDLENQIEKQLTEMLPEQNPNILKELKDLTEQEEQEDNSDLYAKIRELQSRKAELQQQVNQHRQQH